MVEETGLYEKDFVAWSERQARAIEQGTWTEVDAVNVAEELRSLGRELVREAEDRVEILISYLLRWRQMFEYRGFAWRENIDRQRRELADLMTENPSLQDMRERLVADGYEDGRRRLKYETSFYHTDFPPSCPFTVSQVFDASYMPEEWDAPAEGLKPAA